MKKVLTLCLPIRDGKVLLGMKKRGFGACSWNGFGGKVEEGESIEEAAHRELEEESGITEATLLPAGTLEFVFKDSDAHLEVHVFKTEEFLGNGIETEEMSPKWFPFSEIPFEQMWSDDKYWFPLLLEGKKFKSSFVFDEPSSTTKKGEIVSYVLNEIND